MNKLMVLLILIVTIPPLCGVMWVMWLTGERVLVFGVLFLLMLLVRAAAL